MFPAQTTVLLAIQLDIISRHGPLTPCTAYKGSLSVQEYLRLPDDSPRRRLIEQTLGRKNLAKLVQQYQEDEKNREWLENSTTQCPGCFVPCQKSQGLWNVSRNEIPVLTLAATFVS